VQGRWKVVGACLAVLAGCTDDGAATPSTPAVTVTSTTVAHRTDDGVLKIGILLPETGDGAGLGKPLIAAALAARDAINAAGGVLGRKIEVIGNVDEGDTASTAREAIASLNDQHVDAVVGPASSTVALATLAQLMDAGILTCSPTATALALDDFPDRSLFIRTAPSDSLQAMAIAEQAELTGARSAVVVYLDDAYGRPLEKATTDALRARSLSVDEPINFAVDDPILKDEATAVTASDAGVVIVLGDAEQGARMIAAIGDATSVGPGEDAPSIIVNDALRRPPSQELITSLAPAVRNRVIGVSPLASTGAPDEPAGPFAVNAYDCVNLIALAAAQGGSDDPTAMAAQISEVSEGGVSCRMFSDCIQLVNGNRNVDYDGPDGNVQLGPNGDPVRARFDRWGFDDQGNDVSLAIGPLQSSG
jgi:branched-chain amino acid transport system substrate-binding protein